jgi:iron complex transport system ATP-binding protein
LNDLQVAYGARTVLHGLSLSVSPGEIVAVIGPNGAGKTTLINSVSGLLPLQRGCVRAGGADLSSLPAPQRARHLAVVPQARKLHPGFTVRHTVALGRTPYMGWLGRPGPEDQARVEWSLAETGLAALSQRRLQELSGGEQQLVLLARALAQETPILLMDEPTAHLDLQHQSQLLNLVQKLARRHRLAVLMALHDLNLVALYAHRVALLVAGRLQALDTPDRVLTPEQLSAAFNTPVSVIPHPEYGTPLVLPDGRWPPTGEAQGRPSDIINRSG